MNSEKINIDPKTPDAPSLFNWRNADTMAQFLEEDSSKKALATKSAAEQKGFSKNSAKYAGIRKILQSLEGQNLPDENVVIQLLEKDLGELEKMITAENSKEADLIEAEYNSTFDTINFIQNELKHESQFPNFKEWKEKKLAEKGQNTQEKSHKEIAAIKEQIEQQFIAEILNKGGAVAQTSLPRKYSQTGHEGFSNSIDKKRIDGGSLTSDRKIYTRFESLEAEFEKENIHEAISLDPLVTTKYSQVDVPVEKEGFFGKKTVIQKESRAEEVVQKMKDVVADGEDETAYLLSYRTFDNGNKYLDYSHRPGQYLGIGVVIPESLAKTLMSEIRKNPKIVRKIVKNIMMEKFGIPETAWENGDRDTFNVPLSPPYEKWQEENKEKGEFLYFESPDGKQKIKIQ